MPKPQEVYNAMAAFILYMLLQNRSNNILLFTLSGTGHDDILKGVDLPIVSNERCREMHRGSLHITNTKICAGGNKNEGVCEVNGYVYSFFSW